MLTKIGGNTRGCFASESESDWPVSMSLPTCWTMSRRYGLSVWLARMDRHLVSDRPALIIVENWRAKIVTSLDFTPVPNVMLFSEAKPPRWSSSKMM